MLLTDVGVIRVWQLKKIVRLDIKLDKLPSDKNTCVSCHRKKLFSWCSVDLRGVKQRRTSEHGPKACPFLVLFRRV